MSGVRCATSCVSRAACRADAAPLVCPAGRPAALRAVGADGRRMRAPPHAAAAHSQRRPKCANLICKSFPLAAPNRSQQQRHRTASKQRQKSGRKHNNNKSKQVPPQQNVTRRHESRPGDRNANRLRRTTTATAPPATPKHSRSKIKMKRRRKQPEECPPPTSSSGAASTQARQPMKPLVAILLAAAVALALGQQLPRSAALRTGPQSGLAFDAETNSYSGLTFTFEPRLERRVEWLHAEHWLSIMQQSSGILYETLNGRAHLAEIRVLIPHKWRHVEWPVLHKPGSPVMMNRHLRFADSDVIVGFEDPVYRETPFAVQHDECGQKGLNIRMPISFLEQTGQPIEARLRARQFVREFAAHRYGVFKESGFRADFMYPPFASLAGLDLAAGGRWLESAAGRLANGSAPLNSSAAEWQLPAAHQAQQLRGFDELWRECSFDTSPANGLPANAQAANCLPYLTKAAAAAAPPTAGNSFNLMSSDPFSYVELPPADAASAATTGQQRRNASRPLEWRDLAGEQVRWHFCGDNFNQPQQQPNQDAATSGREQQAIWFEHNQRAANKQNKMCHERSALDVIRASDDFRRAHFSPSTFNRLPAPQFKFLQEMPPRVIMCFEYTSHLYQSRRLDHNFIEATVNKFLAFDLIAESEVATVIFGQHFAKTDQFQRLDSSLSTRFTIFNPAVDPFDESVLLYQPNEFASQQASGAHQSGAKILKGTCSLARLMNEVNALLQRANQYDDVGADLIVITSGLFVEDEPRIEDIIRGSNFKLENNRLHLIVYPSTLLFDTKSRDGSVVLDSADSEALIRQRLGKLLLIQRLTQGHIHLVKEHLDANGDIKAATITQFYQIFDHISKGHSWDQTQSMTIIDHKPVEARPLPGQSSHAAISTTANGSTKLTYQFELDASVQNELFVGLLEPKPSPNSLGLRSGKRFSLKSLQLRSPGGQLVFTETSTLHQPPTNGHHPHQHSNQSTEAGDGANPSGESAFFAYRAQMSLAAFHVKPWHLNQLNSSGRVSGTWTLSAISEEPLQTSGIAMARVNPGGDTVTANCWIQTQHRDPLEDAAPSGQSSAALKSIKVFVQTKQGVQQLPPQDLSARLEVQDQFGNIVQNVNMLDDGLGSPDMTRGDGIWSQSVQRAHRLGFYKVTVELTGNASHQQHQTSDSPTRPPHSSNGQDNICCGSTIPQPSWASRPDTRHLTRQLYCGTFYVDAQNELAEQRPPRVNNLTVVNVDQENRRVTVRWYEPLVDIAVPEAKSAQHRQQALDSSLAVELLASDESANNHLGGERTRRWKMSEAKRQRQVDDSDDLAGGEEDELQRLEAELAARQKSPPRLSSGRQTSAATTTSNRLQQEQLYPAMSSRYEIKMFTDRDMVRRAFDARQEVGFKFNEWNVEGVFPNATNYGGLKEVTLRIPPGREGIYFLAMKVYNNLGLGSQLSNIVQFYIRNQLTVDEAESIYGQAATVDAEGNIYDKNGDLLQRAGASGQLNYSLLRGANGPHSLDSLSVLILFSLLAFVMSVVCIALVACLANSARKSLASSAKQRKANKTNGGGGSLVADKQQQQGSVLTNIGSGSSSVVSTSGCGSSQHSGSSEMSSSLAHGHQPADLEGHAHELELSKHLSALGDELTYSVLQQQQRDQQHQAQLIKSQHMMISHPQQQQQHSNYYQPHHTVVNGYTYATVSAVGQQQQPQQLAGDINQNGLVDDGQHSNYQQIQASWAGAEGLPAAGENPDDEQQRAGRHLTLDSSYLVRDKSSANYFNQQLQQQLSNVLKSKRPLQLDQDHSSPALEGVTSDFEMDAQAAAYQQQQQLGPLPPAHYIYCSPGSLGDGAVCGLASQLTEPTIYSQTTNLSAVDSYYANGPGQQQQWAGQQAIYAEQQQQFGQAPPQQQQQYADDYDKSNSAISEV